MAEKLLKEATAEEIVREQAIAREKFILKQKSRERRMRQNEEAMKKNEEAMRKNEEALRKTEKKLVETLASNGLSPMQIVQAAELSKEKVDHYLKK